MRGGSRCWVRGGSAWGLDLGGVDLGEGQIWMGWVGGRSL